MNGLVAAGIVAGIVATIITVIAGTYGTIRLLLRVGGWLNDISDLGMQIGENTRATHANTKELDKFSRAIDDHERRIEWLEKRTPPP